MFFHEYRKARLDGHAFFESILIAACAMTEQDESRMKSYPV